MPDPVMPRSPVLLDDASAAALVATDYARPRDAFPSIGRMVGDQIGLTEAEKVQREQIAEKAYKEGLWAPMP